MAIDAGHSSALFMAKHLGVSNFYGRFNKVSGTYTVDPDAPDNCAMEIEIPTDSLDTNAEGRDQHLKGPQFFNAAEFPTLGVGIQALTVGAVTLNTTVGPVLFRRALGQAGELEEG